MVEQQPGLEPKVRDELRNYFDSLKKQAVLLEELRKMGIVSIIEDVTELPIFHPATDMTFPQFVNALQNAQETYGQYPYADHWSSDMWVPQQTSDGEIDDSLFISLEKAPDYSNSGLVDQVIVRFDRNNNLTIFGTVATFDGLISPENTQINTVQTALQEALDNPRRIGYKSEEYFKLPARQ
ncbi:MAG: hypothetical protein Q8P92_02400 [Candidatus Daviesbacteria bacterium]|nr:hypothetical protein [Candidatus Daviesbacteria bacterium]